MRIAAFALLLAVFGLVASESALARKVLPPGAGTGGGGGGGGHHGGHRLHHHHHSFVGLGFGWGWWGPPAYYYPVPVPAEPVTYVEQGGVPEAQQAWWYYCDAEKGYYPHVKACPAGWQRVPPTPPQ